MKKLTFLTCFILFFSFSFSQDFNEKLKNSRMGLFISPSINFITTDLEQAEKSSKMGLIYGWAIEMALNEHHRLESGFSISYKGGELTNTTGSEPVISNYHVQYISLPIFIKMRSREVANFNYFARIGPSINFKIKDKNSENAETTHPAIIDISIFLGAEYSLGGKTAIETSFFYNNNITNAISASQNKQVLFHQIGLRAGFLF